jgi:hypothetical protein
MFQFLPKMMSFLDGPAYRDGVGMSAGTIGGSFLGNIDNQRQNATGMESTRFDESSIPLFNQQMAATNQAAQQYQGQLQSLFGDRIGALQNDLAAQRNAVSGFGDQEIADINRAYGARAGAVNQSLVSRGLSNSTIAPGMQALNLREQNQALGQARSRQQQYLGSLFGQQAAMMDTARAQQAGALASVGNQQFQLQTLLPTRIATNSVSSATKSVDTRGGTGFLGRLFA